MTAWVPINQPPSVACKVELMYTSGKVETGSYRLVTRKDGPEMQFIDNGGWLCRWRIGDPLTHWRFTSS